MQFVIIQSLCQPPLGLGRESTGTWWLARWLGRHHGWLWLAPSSPHAGQAFRVWQELLASCRPSPRTALCPPFGSVLFTFYCHNVQFLSDDFTYWDKHKKNTQTAVVITCFLRGPCRSLAMERPTENPHGPSCWQLLSARPASSLPHWMQWLPSSPCENWNKLFILLPFFKNQQWEISEQPVPCYSLNDANAKFYGFRI